MSALYIIQDLLEKSNDVFLEHFARLGVISKVSEMVGPLLAEEHDEDETDGAAISQEKKVWKILYRMLRYRSSSLNFPGS